MNTLVTTGAKTMSVSLQFRGSLKPALGVRRVLSGFSMGIYRLAGSRVLICRFLSGVMFFLFSIPCEADFVEGFRSQLIHNALPGIQVDSEQDSLLFILDSGATVNVISTDMLATLVSSGRANRQGDQFALDIPGFEGLKFIAMDLQSIQLGEPTVHGVVGMDFLIAKKIVLSNSFETKLSVVDATVLTEIPMQVGDEGRFYFDNCVVGGETGRFLVDTGSDGSITLPKDRFSALLQERLISDAEETELVRFDHETQRLSSTVVQDGLLKTFQLRNLLIRRVGVTAAFPQSVGAGFLRDLNVELDFQNRKCTVFKQIAADQRGRR
jgi:hypothetical protein